MELYEDILRRLLEVISFRTAGCMYDAEHPAGTDRHRICDVNLLSAIGSLSCERDWSMLARNKWMTYMALAS